MKKSGIIFGFALGLFCLFAVSGCSSKAQPLLDYQNGLCGVSAIFETCDTAYKIDITYTENGAEIEIKEPENISGVKFIREGAEYYGQSGDMKIPVSPKLFSNLDPLFDAFMLSPEKIASITKDEMGNTVYSVSGEEGVYTVFADAQGLPISVAYEGERTFELREILLKKMT